MKQISILGCGWLGLPLAKSCIASGFQVKGSTTSRMKIPLLENYGIVPFQLELTEIGTIGDITIFLKESDILVIDIPPKLRGDAKENFVQKIQNLIPFIEKSTVKKVLFVSSTSVYADDNTSVSEIIEPKPDNESGKQLLVAEYLLQNNPLFKTTIIRFGGLIGEDRHPISFLAGRKNIQNPESPINLIHQSDCIGIIQKIITLDYWGETFNAVAPFHPTRKEYYTQKALALNLALPEFEEGTVSYGKIVLSEKIENNLEYTFKNITL